MYGCQNDIHITIQYSTLYINSSIGTYNPIQYSTLYITIY